ncbi:MAG: carbon-nitrogen hydrolase family protein [Anaerolineae bacterium]|nr:carbon-nitrogen hydrolase family protein [Anaerolineae bacterium]
MHLHVAGAQLPVSHDVTLNVAAIERGIAYAVQVGADVLLTPEGSLSGYTATFDREAVKAGLSAVTDRARVAGLGLALGTCFEEADGLCYNQIRLYDRDGSFLGFHSKQLRCGTLAATPEGEINDYAAAPLRTFTFGMHTIGGLICNDLWANPQCTPMDDPHLTQVLARKGARVLFHAVNGGRDGSEWSRVAWRYHEANLRMRARAGKLWIVTVDCCSPEALPCSAPSGVVSPDGSWICRAAPQGEQFFDCVIDV